MHTHTHTHMSQNVYSSAHMHILSSVLYSAF